MTECWEPWEEFEQRNDRSDCFIVPPPPIILVVYGTCIERQETKVKARKLVKRLTAKISNLSLKIRRKKPAKLN